ncbi:hypothetical protein [Aneurinibacillus terranovensis]|uniref:hypothetical protein n=1 Tax=Aneurinibacillus terranovensis TaxID=278991 RepID=UPI00138B0B80|nr:hypothetical protein [Aneurinibacillus terranovensis]
MLHINIGSVQAGTQTSLHHPSPTCCRNLVWDARKIDFADRNELLFSSLIPFGLLPFGKLLLFLIMYKLAVSQFLHESFQQSTSCSFSCKSFSADPTSVGFAEKTIVGWLWGC